MDIVNSISVLIFGALLALYFVRFRNADRRGFSSAAAWNRAFIVFCAFWILSWLTGTQAMILSSPIATAEQLQDAVWITWTAGLFLFIFVGYWIVWARYTMRFDRRLDLVAQIPFGLLWGISMGQLILMIWRAVSSWRSTRLAAGLVLTSTDGCRQLCPTTRLLAGCRPPGRWLASVETRALLTR